MNNKAVLFIQGLSEAWAGTAEKKGRRAKSLTPRELQLALWPSWNEREVPESPALRVSQNCNTQKQSASSINDLRICFRNSLKGFRVSSKANFTIVLRSLRCAPSSQPRSLGMTGQAPTPSQQPAYLSHPTDQHWPVGKAIEEDLLDRGKASKACSRRLEHGARRVVLRGASGRCEAGRKSRVKRF
jgi:hypothetical protein